MNDFVHSCILKASHDKFLEVTFSKVDIWLVISLLKHVQTLLWHKVFYSSRIERLKSCSKDPERRNVGDKDSLNSRFQPLCYEISGQIESCSTSLTSLVTDSRCLTSGFHRTQLYYHVLAHFT